MGRGMGEPSQARARRSISRSRTAGGASVWRRWSCSPRRALRFEVATPFGLPALVATAGPRRDRDLPGARAPGSDDPPFSGGRRAVARCPTPPGHADPAPGGQRPDASGPATVAVESAPSPHLTWVESGVRHRVWVTAEGRPARLLLERAAGDGDRLATDFEWSAGWRNCRGTHRGPGEGVGAARCATCRSSTARIHRRPSA